jgi:hypothetical protein
MPLAKAYGRRALGVRVVEERVVDVEEDHLLHVPKADLPNVLERIRAQLVPGGLFYLGVYGGNDFEGVRLDDRHEPKRFFAFYRDRDLLTRLMTHFEPVYFRQVAVSEERAAEFHFQSVVLQRTIS